MKKKKKITAVYVRVSSRVQSTRSQMPDLKKYVAAYTDKNTKIHWFVDKMSGKSMDRPEWNKLAKKIMDNRVERLIVWRLDRLGRTAAGLTKLFDELNKRKVKFISVKDGIDLSTSAGRLIANVLASVAAYEIEVGSERIRAGQKAAKAAGKKWGGSKKGRLNTITKEQARAVIKMKADNEKISTIAKTLNMNRTSIYRILERHREGLLDVA
ncbi:MAG: recombinase family protein [Phycisphaerae bacterium]